MGLNRVLRINLWTGAQRWSFSSHDDEFVNVPRKYASVHHRSMPNVKVAKHNSRFTMQGVHIWLKVVLRQLKLPVVPLDRWDERRFLGVVSQLRQQMSPRQHSRWSAVWRRGLRAVEKNQPPRLTMSWPWTNSMTIFVETLLHGWCTCTDSWEVGVTVPMRMNEVVFSEDCLQSVFHRRILENCVEPGNHRQNVVVGIEPRSNRAKDLVSRPIDILVLRSIHLRFDSHIAVFEERSQGCCVHGRQGKTK